MGLLSNSKSALFTTFVAFAALFSPAAAELKVTMQVPKEAVECEQLCHEVIELAPFCRNKIFPKYDIEGTECLPVEKYGFDLFPNGIAVVNQSVNLTDLEGASVCLNIVKLEDSCREQKKMLDLKDRVVKDLQEEQEKVATELMQYPNISY